MYIEDLPEKLNNETQENIPENTVIVGREEESQRQLIKDTGVSIPKAAMIAEKIQIVLRDSGVPSSDVAIIATRIQKLFRDIALPVSKKKYKIDQNVCKNNLKSFGAVESPVRKSRTTG
jgi:hypothetical protein